MIIFSNMIDSVVGMYIVQSCLHSITAAVILRRVLRIWNITDPLVKQRYLLPVIIIPVFSLPIYHILNPGRILPQFRISALFDSYRWLMIDIFGTIPIAIFFLLVMLSCSIIFIFQELLPILRHLRESKNLEGDELNDEYDSFINNSLEELPIEIPDIVVLNDDEHVLYSSTGKSPAVFISSGFLKVLNKDQVQAAIVHEIAHIQRSRKPLLIVLYILRVIMLFNPVVLLVFRRVIQEEERICDDVAVSVTNKAKALAEVLKIQYHKRDEEHSDMSTPGIKETVEEYSYNLQVEGRITRLEQGDVYNEHDSGWVRYALTIIIILVINYFVV